MDEEKSRGRALMFQGTSSHVGKSVLATALCRILQQDGYSVAPFKSQNMSNNSGVTFEGGEMGRAQWVQAEAAGVLPSVLMNPILIKPKGDSTSQVILMGRPAGDFEASQYHRGFTQKALPIVRECLDKLLLGHDAVVIEGAGSPAEVNLKAGDIVNMRIAKIAQAPVILVADIDRGGVFAHIVGTLELLDDDERSLVAGFIINKFRGNLSLLKPGLDFLEQRTGLPVLGVVPYLYGHDIPDEDAVAIETPDRTQSVSSGVAGSELLVIAVVRLPRVSNFTDFEPLARMPGVSVRFVTAPEDIKGAGCVILPGTKNTVMDLMWLRSTGLAEEIVRFAETGPVIGICGGYQMLGTCLEDQEGRESLPGVHEGLGLLDVSTSFSAGKTTTRSEGALLASSPLLPAAGTKVTGYEIHTGVTRAGRGLSPLIGVTKREGFDQSLDDPLDGACASGGLVFGTYFHGIFDNADVLSAFVAGLLKLRGAIVQHKAMIVNARDARQVREEAYERLAAVVRAHVDIPRIYRIMGIV